MSTINLSQAADGYGKFVTVQDLEQLEKDRVRERLEIIRPELLVEGVRIVRAKLEADAAMEQLRQQIAMAVSTDGVRVAFTMFTDEAKRQIAAERASQVAGSGAQKSPKK